MINGIYTVTRGMVAFQKENDVLANNLANVSTVGFKGQQVIYQSFPEMLMSRLDDSGKHEIGSKGSGARVVGTVSNFNAGSLYKTDNDFDLSLEGPGFFAIQTPQGLAYTRNGHFTLNNLGQMVTAEGFPLLGKNGPVQTQGKNIQVDLNGIVKVDGMQDDQIRIADFNNPNALERIGDNLYRAATGVNQVPGTAEVRQGFLEQSNVNVILGMTQLINATRLYEMSQKTIQAQDDTLAKAVNDVGRLG